MPMSAYVTEMRALIGSRLLILPGVTAVIRDESGRYLLARHVAGERWGFVGGGVEPFEDPRSALVRAVAEELGAELSILGVLDGYGGRDLSTQYPNGDVVSYVTTAYLCRLRSEPAAAEPAEVSTIGWFTRAEIGALERFGWIDRVIADAEERSAPDA